VFVDFCQKIKKDLINFSPVDSFTSNLGGRHKLQVQTFVGNFRWLLFAKW